MKFNTEEFKTTLHNTLQFVEQKSTNEAAKTLSFKFNGKLFTIEVMGLDGLTSSYLKIKDNKDKKFDFFISEITYFNKIIGTIKSKEFDFIINENSILIKDGIKEFEIGKTSLDIGEDTSHTVIDTFENINFDELKQVLTTANNFSANDELRPIMNGVNINQEHIVATDSHFLYVINNEILKNITDNITLSKKFINKLSKIKLKEFVNVIISNKTITISSMSFKTSSRLLDGNYPNYKAIIGEFNHSLMIDKIDFESSLNEANIVEGNLLDLTITDKSMVINTDNNDLKQHYVRTIELADKKGEDIVIGFNKNKLSSSINNFNSNEIIIQYERPEKAIKIHADEKVVDEFIILMPMMVQSKK